MYTVCESFSSLQSVTKKIAAVKNYYKNYWVAKR